MLHLFLVRPVSVTTFVDERLIVIGWQGAIEIELKNVTEIEKKSSSLKELVKLREVV